MRTVLWELRKNPFRLAVVAILILAGMALDLAVCADNAKRNTAGWGEEYYAAKDKLYSRVEGVITRENMEWIVSEHNRLAAEIAGGNFSTEYDPDTYTGHVFSDNILVGELFDDAKYAYEYSAFAKGIAERAEAAAAICEKKDSGAEASWYRRVADEFSGREITSFYRTDGWEWFFNYEFSGLLVLILVIAGVSMMFSVERETGMDTVLRLSVNGRRFLWLYKLEAALVFAFVVTTLFYAEDLAVHVAAYGLRGFSNPLYSIRAYGESTVSVSIGAFVAYNYALRLLGVFEFTVFVLLAAGASRNDMWSLGAGALVLALGIAVYAAFPPASFLTLMNSVKLYAGHETLKIFGLRVRTGTAAAVLSALMLALSSAAVALLYGGRRLRTGGEVRHVGAA